MFSPEHTVLQVSRSGSAPSICVIDSENRSGSGLKIRELRLQPRGLERFLYPAVPRHVSVYDPDHQQLLLWRRFKPSGISHNEISAAGKTCSDTKPCIRAPLRSSDGFHSPVNIVPLMPGDCDNKIREHKVSQQNHPSVNQEKIQKINDKVNIQ